MKQDLPINILVVDDEPETADTISLLLRKKCAAQTQSAFNCRSAIEKLNRFNFDLVTLDYQLPDGDGLTLLERIRSLEKAPPVVMVTGHGDENTAVEAFRQGASGYVVKDTRINVMLVEEVKSALLKEELRLAEKALRLNEEKFKDINNYAVEGIISSGPDQCIDYANKKAAEILGFDDPKDLVGQHASDYYADPDARQMIMRNFVEEGNTKDYEVLLKRRDGSSFLARLNASLKMDGNGNLVGATAFFSDITEQKRTEERLVGALNVLPDAVLMMDKNGLILYTNEAMDELLGGKPPAESTYYDIRGKMYQSFIAGTDIQYPREKSPIFRALEGESSIVDDVEIEVDGKLLPLEIIGAPVTGPEGDIQWAVTVTRDITSRKRHEEELKRKNDELDAFAHAVSHDLKGPLASITATAQLLEELLREDVDKDTVELLGIIRSNTKTAWKRIGDFLDLAESGLEPSSIETVDVGELVNNILQVLSPQIRDKKVEVRVEGDMGEIVASRLQIEQVFSNLISNALRHNDSVKPEIMVTRLESGSEAVKKYLVRDNGLGIPAEELEYIFIPFHKKSGSGRSGLGLSIARKIANVYGGDIKAYNCDGACFEVTLEDYETD